ncbi:GNAT family N-acetyltransferase [Kitasatospora sp. CMC57]|uniref:GNAT family N-acetyltransferase n=1 Tax=Kitasatospora sp. CMC57 TaxID=3231513 RepID=A0AB33JNX4_9ACTN
MTTLVRLTATALLDHAAGLGELLTDAVADGASVGFLAGYSADQGARWWRGLEEPVKEGQLLLWAALDGPRVLGTVQLRLTSYPNGRHRADLAKLLVHREARGRGLGRRLLELAEQGAAEHGVTLLLDTQTDSPAEQLYRTAGWTAFGTVPDHAADPAGVLRPTTFFHKALS